MNEERTGKCRKSEKLNNLKKMFGSRKTKGPKQNSQSRLWSHMPEGGST